MTKKQIIAIIEEESNKAYEDAYRNRYNTSSERYESSIIYSKLCEILNKIK